MCFVCERLKENAMTPQESSLWNLIKTTFDCIDDVDRWDIPYIWIVNPIDNYPFDFIFFWDEDDHVRLTAVKEEEDDDVMQELLVIDPMRYDAMKTCIRAASAIAQFIYDNK